MKKFYITTAIDYVNSLPHIGTAYEKIGADVIARFQRMQGAKVFFLMGSDEHSTNVLKAAQKEGLDPKKYCDRMRQKFEAVWKKLDISYDGFIQTTDPAHAKAVQKIFQTIYDNGDIEKRPYEGWYCESCEAFYTEKDLVDGLCPNHKAKPKWLKEENYFFLLSKYQKKLREHIEKHPEFILPETRRNEILRVIDGGLQDISVSRSSVQWGIPVPFDKSHVVYVWFDALINYLTGVGYPKTTYKKWWPADLHVIGKDITRFHSVIWPAMLMAAKIPLPKTVFGHGFVYLKGEKMSKTLGNIVNPLAVADQYGADALRYYLLRTSSFGSDGDFTWEDFIQRYNGDLANGLGNLVSRTAGMIEQYFGGVIAPQKGKISPLVKTMTAIGKRVKSALDFENGEINFHDALAAIWEGITEQDKAINQTKPWELYKQGKKKELEQFLYELTEALRITTILLKPFLPETAEKICQQFGFGSKVTKKCRVQKGENLFPRIEQKVAGDGSGSVFRLPGGIHQVTKNHGARARQDPLLLLSRQTLENKKETVMENLLDISDFAKLDLRVAQVLDAQKVEGADKLLKLQIDLGTEQRQIVAGIAQHYSPDQIVGKKIVVVTNLKPAKIRGVESNGMLLAASGADTVSILTPLKDVPVGSKVK